MDYTLAIFTKPPIAGFVKTRLAPPLSYEDAARLQSAFILDTVRKAGLATPRPSLYYAGGKTNIQEALWESPTILPVLDWKPQGSGDHGARMARVPAPCVMISVNSPTLPVFYLRQALELAAQSDLVLGPASDGGYYLIGLSSPQPQLFEGISWGADQVQTQIEDRAKALGLKIALLPPWYAVDMIDDLERLRTDLQNLTSGSEDDCPATRALLAKLSF